MTRAEPAAAGRASPWFRLLRLPNLLTVPGDPLAGFLLASAVAPQEVRFFPLIPAMAASLCLYAFGLVLNDLVDLETDLRERPERPLPAGEISLTQARWTAVALAISALNLALAAGRTPLFAAAALAVAILLYNARLKRLPPLGALTMGSCRGLSLLLGALAAQPDLMAQPFDVVAVPGSAAMALALYVAGFTAVARHETQGEPPMGLIRWLPFVALLIALPIALAATLARAPGVGMAPTFTVFIMAMALMRAWLLGGMLYRLQPLPATIAGHIRNLLLLQACFCAAAGSSGLLPAGGLILLSFLFGRLAAYGASS